MEQAGGGARRGQDAASPRHRHRQLAERLYDRLGWNRIGVVPDFALYPDGRPCDATIFWKRIDVS